MDQSKADILIIGAGVVGCAIARQCSLNHPGKSIMVLEKNAQAGLESSSHNSGIIHSGIHENPKLLKSKYSIRGNALATEFILGNNLPAKKTGMIIAVPGNQNVFSKIKQLATVFRLVVRGKKLHIPAKFIHAGNSKAYEPAAKITAGIFLPDVYVVSPLEFTQALQRSAEESGATFRFNNTVTGIKSADNQYIISTNEGKFTTGCVINAAGLYADEVAALAGQPNYKIIPWRGEYYEVTPGKYNVGRPISSVMPRHHGKGVQVLPSVDGKLYLGPNSYPVANKNDYTSAQTDPREFIKVAEKLLTGMQPSDLKWAYAGMRSKLNNTYRETDFVIRKDTSNPTLINLIGMDSPGLTASMAIAEAVTEQVGKTAAD